MTKRPASFLGKKRRLLPVPRVVGGFSTQHLRRGSFRCRKSLQYGWTTVVWAQHCQL